jgi:hypothetical protein
VHQYLKRTAGPARWADSARSHHLQRVRQHLLAAGADPEHARDWRPQLLVFTQDTKRRAPLLAFAAWIEGGTGFTEAVQIIEGEGMAARRAQDSAHRGLAEAIASGSHALFPLTVCAPDVTQAMGILIQSSGIGPLRPNTVVLNWMGESAKAISGIGAYNYVKNLRLIFHQGKNLVVLRMDPESWERLGAQPREARRIDVWWQGNASSRLMLLLAHLMTRNEPWDKTTLRVLTQGDGSRIELEKEKLNKVMEDIRIDAAAEIVENFDADTIVQQSADATFVFLPLTIRQNRILDPTGQSFERSLPRLPVSAVVMAAEDIDLDAAPEEGLAAQIARAADDLDAARKKAAAAEKVAAEKQTALEMLNRRLNALENKGVSGVVPLDAREELQAAIKDAASGAEKAHRQAIKAKVKADDAAKTIDALNPGSTSEKEPPK